MNRLENIAVKRTALIKEQIKAIDNLKAAVRGKLIDDYYAFFIAFWPQVSPDEYIDNWHIKKIAGRLQEAGLRLAMKEPKVRDILINIPPGESKSTLVTVLFPVWLWLHNPSLSIISSSYSGGLSTDLSRKSKDVFKSDLFQDLFQDYFQEKFGARIRLVKDNENYWENNFKGFRATTSTGGTVTGRHADLILRDDPINPEQAESAVYRMKALRFNNGTLSRRKRDARVTLTITVMQRLHQKDQTGFDLETFKDEVEHICLPAEVTKDIEPKEWTKYYKNGLLNPVRLNRKELEAARKTLGSRGYAGQMLQNPVAVGGNILKESWFYTISQVPEGIVWDVFLDTAYTEKQENDPTGVLVVGYDIPRNRLIIKNYKAVYMEMPELLKWLPGFFKENGITQASEIYVEPKASGKSLVQMMRSETFFNISEIKGKLVQAGKMERANYIAPFAEGGRIALIEGNWNEAYIVEITSFPNAEHDETIDTTAYAVRKYLQKDL